MQCPGLDAENIGKMAESGKQLGATIGTETTAMGISAVRCGNKITGLAVNHHLACRENHCRNKSTAGCSLAVLAVAITGKQRLDIHGVTDLAA